MILEILDDTNAKFEKIETTRDGLKIFPSPPADYDKLRDILRIGKPTDRKKHHVVITVIREPTEEKYAAT